MLKRSAQSLLPRLLQQGQSQGAVGCLSALNHLPSWNINEEKPSASALPQQWQTYTRCKMNF